MTSNLLVFETNMATELVTLIDNRLAELTAKYGDPAYADLIGYYDFMEHVTGLGFVALQAHIAAACGVCRMPKSEALALGPVHRGGSSIARIVNAAANYWKHNHEWSADKSHKQRLAIEKVFENMGFPVDTEYPLSGVLAEISAPAPASLDAVMQLLSQWQDQLQRSAA